jgi:hypothetical protein
MQQLNVLLHHLQAYIYTEPAGALPIESASMAQGVLSRRVMVMAHAGSLNVLLVVSVHIVPVLVRAAAQLLHHRLPHLTVTRLTVVQLVS